MTFLCYRFKNSPFLCKFVKSFIIEPVYFQMTKNFISPSDFGIYGVASVSPEVAVGNPRKNAEYILNLLRREELQNCQFIVFPELCITGYTSGDLFFQRSLLIEAEKVLIEMANALSNDNRLIAVGVPLLHDNKLYNCAAVICRGEILGIVPKTHIPNYQEFYEKRWFTSGKDILSSYLRIENRSFPFGSNLIFRHLNVNIGVEICEDLWVPSPPSSNLCVNGAEIILNLSATDETIGKFEYINSLVASQSARCRCVYAYASAGKGESSTDLVFSGINLIAYDGKTISSSDRFFNGPKFAIASVDVEKLRHDRLKYSTFNCGKTDIKIDLIDSGYEPSPENKIPRLKVNPYPFIPTEDLNKDCKEIISIQSWGLKQRLEATGCNTLVVGISGGLDSTLAILLANHAFKTMGLNQKNIIGVTMPADATSERTKSNAHKLMALLGVNVLEIPIRKAVEQHFQDISHDSDVYDSVYENSQARERTQILMDLANKYSGIVLGTGDLSELALGWCTYNGDHMSMYNVNAGVPKTLVKYLVKWFAETSEDHSLKDVLLDIIDTPISPELVPSENSTEQIGQKTEDLVGPYDLHDFFLFHMIRNGFSPDKIFFLASLAFDGKFSKQEIKKWLVTFYKRFFSQQFKRSCMPDGPKIGSVCLSPRGDWRMPSDASAQFWISQAENIKY